MSANIDLTSCDQEKIHLFTSIQSHGTFLSLNRTDLKIYNVSENLSAFFNLTEESSFFLGKRLVDVFSLELATKILQRLRSTVPYFSALDHSLGNGKMIEVHLYPLNDELVGIEFETYESTKENDKSSGINNFLERMQNAKTLAQVSEVACSAVRYLSGFDRVMIYRFFPPEMYGEVIAEDRVASAQTFLNHRFPATDIPRPARDLYLRNKVRYIHDAAGESSKIQPPVYDKKIPLDLSDSRLRSVSQIHLEYLKNMGVRGSMSVAIIAGGNLWGIISCHHPEPLYVSQANRRLCLQVANTLAMIAPLMENLKSFSNENNYYIKLHDFFGEISQESDPLSSIFKKIDKLNALFSSHGVAYVTPSKVTTAGITPLSKNMKDIWEVLRKKMIGDVFETQRLSSLDEKFGDFINCPI